MAQHFQVELVSVEAKIWSGEADTVVARTTEGELAVLAGHAPLLGQLKDPSRIRIKTAGGDDIAYDIGGGFLSINNDTITVLAENASPAEGPDPAVEAALGNVTADAH